MPYFAVFSNSNFITIGATDSLLTTDMPNVNSVVIGGKPVTNLAQNAGGYIFTFPAFTDGKTTAIGQQDAVISNGLDTISKAVVVAPPTGYGSVILAGALNHTITGILYNFNPAAVAGDSIVFPTNLNTSVNAQGGVATDIQGFKTYWHIQKSTNIARKFVVTTGAAPT